MLAVHGCAEESIIRVISGRGEGLYISVDRISSNGPVKLEISLLGQKEVIYKGERDSKRGERPEVSRRVAGQTRVNLFN